MLDEGLRRRIEALNRGRLPSTGPSTATASLLAETSPPSRKARPFVGLLERGDVVPNNSGEHLRIRLPLESLWPGGTRLVAARQEHLRQKLALANQAVEPIVVMNAEFAAMIAAMPDRALALDLETCGLGGSALFLAGLLRHADDGPVIELLLARNYAEEQAVLESLWQIVAAHEVLLTFNGKSFDWPMVLDRSARYRIKPPVASDGANPRCEMLHLDLLHHARRRWRRLLPDCRLLTLEQIVCRRKRVGDIPGHHIPAAYAEFVRTGFQRDMEAILYHNAMDLLTILDLALRLAS